MAQASTSAAEVSKLTPAAATVATERKLLKRSTKNIFCIGDAIIEFYCFTNPEALRPYRLLEDEKHEYTKLQGTLFNDVVALYGAKSDTGGSVPRSAWAARWINQDPHSTVSFVGAIGDDAFSRVVDTNESKTLVLNHYDKQQGQASGVIAAIATSSLDRTTCTLLDAEKNFRREFLEEEGVGTRLMECHLIYTDAIFLSHSGPVLWELVTYMYVSATYKYFALNLSAEYVVENEHKGIIDILPKLDILFGGRREILALHNKISSDYTDVAIAVRALADHEQSEEKQRRLVVCTDGANPVLYCQTGGTVGQFKVPAIENIHDTVGARDAFIGAFLAIRLQTEDITTAISAGVKTARVVLQKPRFQLPENVPEELNFFL